MRTSIKIELGLINSSNPFPNTGIGVWMNDESPSEIREMYGFDLKPHDVVLSYDLYSDTLSRSGLNGTYEGSEEQIWYDWVDKEFFAYINGHMEKLGYERVDDIDGSGGGLVYGCIHFKRKGG